MLNHCGAQIFPEGERELIIKLIMVFWSPECIRTTLMDVICLPGQTNTRYLTLARLYQPTEHCFRSLIVPTKIYLIQFELTSIF